MSVIDDYINGPVDGHQQFSLNDSPMLGDPPSPDPAWEGTVSESRMIGRENVPSIHELIDRQVEGHTGPSLDGFTPVWYRGDTPGRGSKNNQPMQSGNTIDHPVVASQEVGVGKPPEWDVARMPIAEGVNPTRSSYAYQGVFADGQEYTIGGGMGDEAVLRQHSPTRAPAWMIALASDDQQAESKILSQFPGSAIIEAPPAFSMAELLGRVGSVSWGVQ